MNEQIKIPGGHCVNQLLFSFLLLLFFNSCKERQTLGNGHSLSVSRAEVMVVTSGDSTVKVKVLDTASYKKGLQLLANGDKSGKWPATAAIPLAGALLPFNRVVAYYGNFYSTRMGVLGEYPIPVMLQKLKSQVQEWEKADTLTRVVPALHYIAVTAQASPGDGNYRLRMPEKEIRKAIRLADSIKGIVFLDIQVGLSNIQKELPLLKKYLMLPNVHLGVDPEFSMKTGKRPGTVIGTMDATDINYITASLASIVTENHLPPKILVVHRFTLGMLTNFERIATLPEVQIVVNMDGFGSPILKKNSYYYFVYKLPVQFTGFKLFYKNDVKTGGRMMTPFDVLQLQPRPIYIQYQ